MAAPTPRLRLRISSRSIAASVGIFALTLVLLRVFVAAGRVIGWMLVAAAFAGLLHPLVSRLARWMPRGLAAVLVMVVAIGITALVVRGLVKDVIRETAHLQQSASEATTKIEQSKRFGDFAQSIQLHKRMDGFMRRVPELLAGGGTPTERFRAAATRGVAFMATAVLTLFLLLHGPRIAAAGLNQIADEHRRSQLRHVGLSAYHRAFGYARGTLLAALANGALAYALSRAAGLRGAGALAVWVALWSVVPVAGSTIGALPIIVLGALQEPWQGALLAVAFGAVQAFEDLVWQPHLERRTLALGPFLTLVSGLVGVELRGLPGALLGVLGMAIVAAVLDDLTPDVPSADVRDVELADPKDATPGDVVDEQEHGAEASGTPDTPGEVDEPARQR
jgi:putative heme transporter